MQPSCEFRLVFEQGLSPSLLLTPGPPFTILAVTDAYLRATRLAREEMVGRPLFEVCPEEQDAPQSHVLRALQSSLNRVLDTKVPDTLAMQQYDLPRPESAGGGVEERHWSGTGAPPTRPSSHPRARCATSCTRWRT